MAKDEKLATLFPKVTFGDGVQVIRVGSISIGAGSVISDHSWLNACESTFPQKTLKIGRKVLIGRRSMVSSAKTVEIADYCVLGPNVHVSNADHGFTDISQPILQQAVVCQGTLLVEENCWLGTNVVIMGHVTIGRGSVIGANRVVMDSIPPFCIAVGSPARVVKMWNPQAKNWQKVHSSAEVQEIEELRKNHPIPSRAELLTLLDRNCSFAAVPAIVAGRGELLDDRPAPQKESEETPVAPPQNDILDQACTQIWQENPQWMQQEFLLPDPREAAVHMGNSTFLGALLDVMQAYSQRPLAQCNAVELRPRNASLSWNLARVGVKMTAVVDNSSQWMGEMAARQLSHWQQVVFRLQIAQEHGIPSILTPYQFALTRFLQEQEDLVKHLQALRLHAEPGACLIAMHCVVSQSPFQQIHYLANHPLHQKVGGQNCYSLEEYQNALQASGWILEATLDPSAPLNAAHPAQKQSSQLLFSQTSTQSIYPSLYSFIARNPG